MFSRLLFTRLRAAEKALLESRLDEAHRLLTAPDIRAHRRGGTLLADLCEKLVERARTHFAGDRFTEALTDLDKADAGGHKLPQIAELRQNILTVAKEVNRQEQSRRRRLDDARQRIEAGSLVAGRQILKNAEADDLDAQELAADIEERARQADDAFARVRKLLDDGQVSGAIERFQKARHLAPQSPEAISLESALTSHVVVDARKAFESGRINRAAEELARLAELGRGLSVRRDIEDVVELARGACRAVDGGDFETARRQMMRLQGIAGDIRWVGDAVKQLEELDELMTRLISGPLGENGGTGGRAKAAGESGKRRTPALDETMVLPHRNAGTVPLPDRLLLLVDGGGSFLLLRKDRVSIGRAITDQPADVAFKSDLAERHAEIARVDDDYFLFATRDIDLDGRGTRHQLLRDGNRVTLARNARFTFRLPHRQSASGLLEMSSATRMPHDVRRVVLFQRNAMIGFGKHVHINCTSAVHDLILFERTGRLWIRPQGNGRIDTEARPVEIGKPVEMFNISFVIQPWQMPTTGPKFS